MTWPRFGLTFVSLSNSAAPKPEQLTMTSNDDSIQIKISTYTIQMYLKDISNICLDNEILHSENSVYFYQSIDQCYVYKSNMYHLQIIYKHADNQQRLKFEITARLFKEQEKGLSKFKYSNSQKTVGHGNQHTNN